jgi:hypothetical protein
VPPNFIIFTPGSPFKISDGYPPSLLKKTLMLTLKSAAKIEDAINQQILF